MTICGRLPSLFLLTAIGLAGCGKDAPEPLEENFGGGLGKSYNDMLDQAKQSADQSNRQMQDMEQRIRDSQ